MCVGAHVKWRTLCTLRPTHCTASPARSAQSVPNAPGREHVTLTLPMIASRVTARLIRSSSSRHASCARKSSPSHHRSLIIERPFAVPSRVWLVFSPCQFAFSARTYGRHFRNRSSSASPSQPRSRSIGKPYFGR